MERKASKDDICNLITRLYPSKSKYDLEAVAKQKQHISMYLTFIINADEEMNQFSYSPMINKKSIHILNKKYKREMVEKQEKLKIEKEPWVLFLVK